jgi:hypothetical protein
MEVTVTNKDTRNVESVIQARVLSARSVPVKALSSVQMAHIREIRSTDAMLCNKQIRL